MEWYEADDLKKEAENILSILHLPHIDLSRIFFFRTQGSKSRSYARIWAMPKIFQKALGIEPAYVIEVLAQYYDKLDKDGQRKVLIHEFLHIPKNFSGALAPHRRRGKHLSHEVNRLFKEYKKVKKY